MARRIPLPRLSRRQRLARWQRERRQQLIYLATFSTLLVFVLGIVAWGLATQYYDANLKAAARIGERSIPMRDFNKRFTFDKTRYFHDVGIPPEQQNDPRVAQQTNGLRKGSLDSIVLGETLLAVAREDGAVPSTEDVEARFQRDYSELHVRHILITPDANEKDGTKRDADAKAKADEVAKQLKADASNDQLWKDLATKESADTGTKDNGGDLGWVSALSGFVKEFENAMYALKDGEVSDPVKSQFGYHVLQRIATRAPTSTDLYAAFRKAGLSLSDLRLFARNDLLQQRYKDAIEAREIPSPQEQVHLADVVINLPPPTNLDLYKAALEKINAVLDGLAAGKDFAELAKSYSDDGETKEQGGDMGWLTRSMLPNKTIADDVFARAAGERSDQHTINAGDIVIYKVLEKDPARAVTDEQKAKIKDEAFTLWLDDQEVRLGVLRLIQGLEF